MSETLSKVIEVVADTLSVERDQLKPSSKFVDDLGADSLEQVELMMALEAAFDCDIPDEDAAKIVSIEDAVKYIDDNVQKD